MDVFSFFVSYKGYHKKGTLDFKQQLVKELFRATANNAEIIVFSTLMQTIHKQLYERTKIIIVIDAAVKGFLFPTAKVANILIADYLSCLLYTSPSPRD